MNDSIKAALILGEKCLDIKGIILQQGEGIILLDDHTVNIVAGELSDELLQELLLQRGVIKRKHTPVQSTE